MPIVPDGSGRVKPADSISIAGRRARRPGLAGPRGGRLRVSPGRDADVIRQLQRLDQRPLSRIARAARVVVRRQVAGLRSGGSR